ncbi:MAG: hypothetical protein PVI99_00365 [Anaerolineales bacterium]|jgi:hypothetical protein
MNERIRQLTQQIEDLKRRLPAHSIPPAMMAELDELEAQLAEEIAQQAKEEDEQ